MSSPNSIKISVCKSCLKDLDFKPSKFGEKLAEQLEAVIHSEHEIKIEITSCLKICPTKNIAFSLRTKSDGVKQKAVRTTALGPNVGGVIKEVLSLVDKALQKERTV